LRIRTRGNGTNIVESTAGTIHVDADLESVMAVIADLHSYPEWVSDCSEAEVLEADEQGYPRVARLVLGAAVLKDSLVVEYEWPTGRTSVHWNLVSSSLLRDLRGAYHLSLSGSGTEVVYELSIDLVVPIIGLLKRKAERRLIESALKDLKRRVEGSVNRGSGSCV
jgi:ribosome-associated toxin RatA of RatAB toxin-antitoxin module